MAYPRTYGNTTEATSAPVPRPLTVGDLAVAGGLFGVRPSVLLEALHG